ncbi:MAG: NHL repeat-containing protein [Planctomycetes bacterium]|nr:NHL repeat-containing protein [Planctomycetota bacterium]
MDYLHVQVIAGKGNNPRQFTTTLLGIALDRQDCLHAVGDSEVKLFNADGTLRQRFSTSQPGHCLTIDDDGTIYVGETGQIELFDAAGHRLNNWRTPDRLGRVTALGLTKGHLFAADVDARCLRRFDRDGKHLGDIGNDNRMKGFLVPNGVLDFAIDARGVIHAANPGKHRVERYTASGELLGHFGRFDGRDPAGFRGCCNPTNVALTGDGRVIVSEKATPRVKAYDAQGKLLTIIASDVFDPNCKNMDIAVDTRGRIYIIDTMRLQIHVFAADQGEATTRPSSPAAPGVGQP